MTTIVTKNSSTASATPAAGDLTKGELAVNVTDKKLYTKDNSATVVKIVGSLGNQEANAVAITGGSIAGITDLAVADGGTGASSAADARTNLGVTATGADTAYAFRSNNLSDLSSASTARTNLGLGTIATQAASNVTITGGSVTGITDITVADGGTGASTAANARTNLGLVIGTDVLAPNGSAALLTSFPTLNQNTTGNAATVTTNANLTGAVTSTGNATSLGSFTSSNLAGALTDETGSGSAVFATSPTLVTPILGTPTSATLTNATGLPLSTGVTGTLPIANGGTGQTTATAAFNALAPNQATNSGKYLTTDGTNSSWATVSSGSGTVTSVAVSGGTTGLTTSGGPITTSGTVTLAGTLAVANGGTGVTTSTGTGNTVLSTSPTLVTPILGTPTSGTLTNATGLPISTGVSGLGTGVATALAVNVGSAGAPVVNGGALGTPSSGTVTNLTGTASININGTVGATTPTTVVATTVKASTTMGVGAATPSASGAGITFPATQSASTDANTLDDYEEGTWTPANPNVTYTTAVGTYTKIGRVVQWQAYIQFPSTANTSQAQITGLPFTVANSENARAGSAITGSNYGAAFYGLPVNNGTIVYFYTISMNAIQNADLSGKYLWCGGTYIV